MKQTNETHIHVGTKGRGFVIIILWLLAGCIIGSVATAKYGHYVGIGKTNDVAFTTNGNGLTVTNEGTETPLTATTDIKKEDIQTVVRYVPVKQQLTQHELDSIAREYYANKTSTIKLADKNVAVELKLDVSENTIQGGTFTSTDFNPPPKTHLYVGGGAQINISPFALHGAMIRSVLIPANSKIAYQVSYDPLNKSFEVGAMVRLTRQFPKQ